MAEVVVVRFWRWFAHTLFNSLSTFFVDKAGRGPKQFVFFVFSKIRVAPKSL